MFTARAMKELERILALSHEEVKKEVTSVRSELRAAGSFNLQTTTLQSCAWLPGLFSIWLRKEGAALMRGARKWGELMNANPADTLDAPSSFSLDGVQFDLAPLDHYCLDSNKLKKGVNMHYTEHGGA